MKPNKTPHAIAIEKTLTPRDFRKVAKDFGAKPAEIKALYDLMDQKTGTITGDPIQDAEIMAVTYSKLCAADWCCGWVGFDWMPDWQERVLAKLDE